MVLGGVNVGKSGRELIHRCYTRVKPMFFYAHFAPFVKQKKNDMKPKINVDFT